MISSISPFRFALLRKVPPRLVLVVVVAAGAWLFSAFYTLHWNPEIKVFKHAAEVKIAWSKYLDEQYTNKFVVFGGSSSTFSVDAGYALRECHVPIANLALGAGLGAKVLSRFALEELRPGDTAVMMMEPGLFASDLDPPQLGTQLSIAIGKPHHAHPSRRIIVNERLPWRNYFAALRPGGYHFFTLLGKWVRRQPLYRYAPADFDHSGHQQTSVRRAVTPPGTMVTLSPDAREWLLELKSHCEEQGIYLIYALPWAYCPPELTAKFQRENAAFLLQMSEFMTVLREDRLGAYSTTEHFADTSFHLNKEGAAIRTSELCRALSINYFWRQDELRSQARQ